MSRIVSIIPGRGNSKGIPRKNLVELGDKPLIVHTIEQSLDSKLIDDTIVSTEDKTIKSISESNGATIIDRPKKLSSDTATAESVIFHVLQEIERKPDIVVLLQCTSPFRKRDDIDNQINHQLKYGYDSVFSVCRAKEFIWNEYLDSITYDYKNRIRRQNFPIYYKENGAIYTFKRSKFEEEKNRICGRKGIYIMDELSMIEIDEPKDLEWARKVYNIIHDK